MRKIWVIQKVRKSKTIKKMIIKRKKIKKIKIIWLKRKKVLCNNKVKIALKVKK